MPRKNVSNDVTMKSSYYIHNQCGLGHRLEFLETCTKSVGIYPNKARSKLKHLNVGKLQ